MINFELKSATISPQPLIDNGDGTMTYGINIIVGVVGVPDTGNYAEMKASFGNVPYTFSKALTINAAEAGIQTFATQWVTDNFPPVE